MQSQDETSTRICPFEVPPGAEAEFLEGWERTAGESVLYRALRSDVDFRFVAVGPAGTGDLYETVHDEGEVDAPGGTVLIDPFEVPPGEDDPFLAAWHEAREAVATERGFLGTRLYRSVEPDAEFRFVEIARWSSPLMVAQATAKAGNRRHHALYERVPASPK